MIPALDAWASPFYTVLVMPLADCTFHRFVADNKLPSAVVMRLALHLARGLQHIHSKMVVHRDLHAGNVLVQCSCDKPSDILFLISDFGQATMSTDNDGAAAMYPINVRPPEIWFGLGASMHSRKRYIPATEPVSYSFPADVWALACLLLMRPSGGVAMTRPTPSKSCCDEYCHILQLVKACGTPTRALVTQLKWTTFFGDACPAELRGIPGQDGSWTDIPALRPVLRQVLVYDPAQRLTAAEIEKQVHVCCCATCGFMNTFFAVSQDRLMYARMGHWCVVHQCVLLYRSTQRSMPRREGRGPACAFLRLVRCIVDCAL